MSKVIVVGGGLGGLTTAIKLAYDGFAVTLFEKEQTLGGKLQTIEKNGYQFDLGPSTITMRHVFESIFTTCNRNPADYLSFYPIKTGTRNFFHDGTIVDFNTDSEAVAEQIACYSEHDARNYQGFLAEAGRLYQIAERSFFNQLLYSTKAKLSPSLIRDFMTIHPFQNLDRHLKRYFKHPNTLNLFRRYATYVGSSPFQAPAIYGMIAHLEGEQGIWGIKGGTYQLIRALERLAKELGVDIQTGIPVTSIIIKQRKVTGVVTAQGERSANCVVINADPLFIYQHMLTEHPIHRKLAKKEPSLSGFSMLIGSNKCNQQLRHHNVFFPKYYNQEFSAIFSDRRMPDQPTLYICQSSYSEPERAPIGGSNLFLLVNAPALSERFKWNEQTINYLKQQLSYQLAHFGIEDIFTNCSYHYAMTPKTLQQRTTAYKGAIYGLSSNSFRQAFFRLANKDPYYEHLFFVGGSTHPGGGTPMVVSSGILVAKEIMKRYGWKS
ncbi:phytoene desaturase [Amphibacillus marinus]|uniref:4,4'-diaponeurosporene oxygenase n=1 Tax=Amphibacillus marinus TaxID=872970 RepID=A0A1H8GPN0_9BACI|nr:phytoene desaturase family protein [Amphibacillus marinus]SEN45457.1 phytoene desaturase [Amphibacillus marinus]